METSISRPLPRLVSVQSRLDLHALDHAPGHVLIAEIIHSHENRYAIIGQPVSSLFHLNLRVPQAIFSIDIQCEQCYILKF